MTWFETILGKWVVNHRWWIIIATILVVFIASSGMRFLTVNNNTRVFFSEENPQLQAAVRIAEQVKTGAANKTKGFVKELFGEITEGSCNHFL